LISLFLQVGKYNKGILITGVENVLFKLRRINIAITTWISKLKARNMMKMSQVLGEFEHKQKPYYTHAL